MFKNSVNSAITDELRPGVLMCPPEFRPTMEWTWEWLGAARAFTSPDTHRLTIVWMRGANVLRSHFFSRG